MDKKTMRNVAIASVFGVLALVVVYVNLADDTPGRSLTPEQAAQVNSVVEEVKAKQPPESPPVPENDGGLGPGKRQMPPR